MQNWFWEKKEIFSICFFNSRKRIKQDASCGFIVIYLKNRIKIVIEIRNYNEVWIIEILHYFCLKWGGKGTIKNIKNIKNIEYKEWWIDEGKINQNLKN